jgi:WS/DGAT/MGAT family acyltransferase
MEVMSPLDSAFLRLEDGHTSLHIASVAIFDGPQPSFEQIAARVEAKLPQLPRYRQKVREVPLWLGAPVWVDDPNFLLSNHLRRAALPKPGSNAQLQELVGQLMSRQLDRGGPLWETWIVEGLEDDRWALIGKVHHCMVDGIAGTDLLSLVLDSGPDAALPDAETWRPASEPGPLALLASALGAVPRHPVGAIRHLSAGLRHPKRVVTSAVSRLHGMFEFAELARPAPASSLSGPIGTARCWSQAQVTLDDVRVIRRALGGTVNDVVLAAVTQGFRELLISRGETPTQHAVRALVPVSVRTAQQRGHFDNQITAMVAELPVHVVDPVERLQAVRAELDRLKRSGEAQAGVLVTQAAKFVPPLLISAGLTGLFRIPQRFLVTVATNVPGPRRPLYLAGRRLRELYPYVPIADRLRIGVAISSYDGVLYFGATADEASSPDVGVLTAGIEDALRTLLKSAEETAVPRPE